MFKYGFSKRLYFLSDIYYVGGTAVKIFRVDLVDDLLEEGVEAHYFADKRMQRNGSFSRTFDCILLMGARDPSLGEFALYVKELLENLKKNVSLY